MNALNRESIVNKNDRGRVPLLDFWPSCCEPCVEHFPIWQLYGVLPEHRMQFPLYVVIDAKRIVRVGSKDLAKAEKVLEALLR